MNAFISMLICISISKAHGNHKPGTCNRYTQIQTMKDAQT